MTALSESVHELTRDHKHFITRDDGTREAVDEMSLLEQLENAKTMRLHTGGGPTDGGGKLPFGAGPADIEHDIIRTIHRTAPIHNRYELASMPLPQRIQRWVGFLEESLATEWVRYWSEAIRDLFRTKFFLNCPCPMCGVEKIEEENDGEVTIKDPIMVTVDTQVAGCLSCGNVWVGVRELEYLSSLVG